MMHLPSTYPSYVDFIDFSYYSTTVAVKDMEMDGAGNVVSGMKNLYLEANDWGWQIDPQGLRYLMRVFYERYEKPLFIVENGLGYNDTFENGEIHDPYRIAYLKAHIEEMKRAVEEDGYTPCTQVIKSNGEKL